MKKFACIVCTAALALSFAACGSTFDTANENSGNIDETEYVEESAVEDEEEDATEETTEPTREDGDRVDPDHRDPDFEIDHHFDEDTVFDDEGHYRDSNPNTDETVVNHDEDAEYHEPVVTDDGVPTRDGEDKPQAPRKF